MNPTKQQRETTLCELVETHNLVLALRRLQNTGSHDDGRWRRALYHALTMTYSGNSSMRTKIREALELP